MHSIMPSKFDNLLGMSQIRTPPSLKWLIDKRARLHGELLKLEKSHPKNVEDAKMRVLEAEKILELAKQKLLHIESAGARMLNTLRWDIESVDNTLGFHEIQISPGIIPPIRTQDAERYANHGCMTRAIFERLKLAGGQPVNTLELTDFVAAKLGVELTENNYQDFRNKIRNRLKTLYREGKVRRLHQVKGAVVGRWTLTDDPEKMESALNPKYGRPGK